MEEIEVMELDLGTLIAIASAILTAMAGAIAALWNLHRLDHKRTRKDLDECKEDRKALGLRIDETLKLVEKLYSEIAQLHQCVGRLEGRKDVAAEVFTKSQRRRYDQVENGSDA